MSSAKIDLLLKKILFFCFNFLILATPFFFTWVNDELFEFNKMILTYLVTIFIGCIWIARMIVTEKIIFRKTYLDLPITLFLLSQILSTLLSMHPRTSLLGYYGRFNGGLISIFCYVTIFYAFVSNFDRKQIKSIFLSLFVAALGVAFYAIPEHFGHSPSCLLITNGKNFDVSCWVQDVQNRVFSTFGQPNWLAAYSITLIPLGISLALTLQKKSQTVFYGVTTSLLFTVLLFTKSRSGFLGILIGLLVYGILLLVSKLRSTSHNQLSTLKPQMAIALLLVSAFLGLSLLFGTSFSPSLNQLFQNPTNSGTISEMVSPSSPTVDRLEVGGTDSGEIRKIVWKGAIDIWKRYPLFGSGVETFAYSYYKDRPMEHNLVSEWDFLYNKAHNEFLNYLATTGIVGLGTYLLLLGWFGWQNFQFVTVPSYRKRVPSRDERIVAIGLLSGVISLSVSNFFGFSTVMVNILLFLYFAIFAIIKSDPTAKIRPDTQKTIHLGTFHFFSAGILGLFGLYMLMIVYNMWDADVLYANGKNLSKTTDLIQGAQTLEKAIQKSPHEAIYQDELSSAYAQIAVALAESEESTLAAQFTQKAIETSTTALNLNPVHLNIYKNRARIFIILAQLNPQYLDDALETLEAAQQLAPTDPKIMYNRGLILLEQGKVAESQQLLADTLKMKPNYGAARTKLAQVLASQGKIDEAIKNYQYILDYINPDDETTKQQIEKLQSNSTTP